MSDYRVKTPSGWIVRLRLTHRTFYLYREGLTRDGAAVDEVFLVWPSTNPHRDEKMIREGLDCNSIDPGGAPLDLVPRLDPHLRSKHDREEASREGRSWNTFWKTDAARRRHRLGEA